MGPSMSARNRSSCRSAASSVRPLCEPCGRAESAPPPSIDRASRSGVAYGIDNGERRTEFMRCHRHKFLCIKVNCCSSASFSCSMAPAPPASAGFSPDRSRCCETRRRHAPSRRSRQAAVFHAHRCRSRWRPACACARRVHQRRGYGTRDMHHRASDQEPGQQDSQRDTAARPAVSTIGVLARLPDARKLRSVSMPSRSLAAPYAPSRPAPATGAPHRRRRSRPGDDASVLAPLDLE